MAITSMTKSIPMPRKRTRGLTIMIRSIINARTPLAMGCFYGVLIALLLAALYPSISKANLGSYLSSSVLSGLLGARITTFSGFTVFLGVELYSSFYGLLFGGIMAYIGGAALPVNIENGTLDLALSRPISRTRYYMESWLAVLVCGAIIGLATVFAVWLDTLILKNTDINWQWLWITQLVQWAFFFFAAGLGMLLGSFINASRAAGGASREPQRAEIDRFEHSGPGWLAWHLSQLERHADYGVCLRHRAGQPQIGPGRITLARVP